MKKLALLIGVSEYEPWLNPLPSAVRDMKAMEKVLKDPELGGFDEVKTLANPDRQTMESEIETLFSNRCKDDFALLFFSGHGIKDDSSSLHFATRNTSKSSQGQLIWATAASAEFIHKTMSRSRAKRQAVILDCCFSGAFGQFLKAKDDGTFDLKGQLGSEGRVVLASSSSTQYSFEQEEEELSIFTQYLVEGIETGAGDFDKDGKISIQDLHKYVIRKVQDRLPNVTPKIIVLKDEGFDIFLSKVKGDKERVVNTNENKVHLGDISLEAIQNPEGLNYYNSIPSLLQSMHPLIARLIEHLNSCYLAQNDHSSISIATDYILEILRLASDAAFVFLMTASSKEGIWNLEAQSTLSSEIDTSEYTEAIRTKIFSSVSTESIFKVGHHGIYRIIHNEKTTASEACILIPTSSSNHTQFIAVCGLSQNSQYLNDVYTKIVSSFYKATQRSYSHPSRVEADLLDDLKRDYGFIPISFYNRRLELFCERLSQIVIHFEPILDMRNVAITSWEALARDPESLTAPVDLFDAAELWGKRFIVELDMRLLNLAVRSYREASMKGEKNRARELSPLSVNVYPESLMRRVYFEAVRKITTEDEEGEVLLPADSLVLEISEKAKLPSYQNGMHTHSPLKIFIEKLVKYTQELGVRFSIDDFGVGYASVDRLASLNPPYVKIDRNILHQPQAETIIRFVQEVVSQSAKLHSAKIIVEGLDEDSPVSLYRLKQIGVFLVQGYSIGKAGSDIYRLTPEDRNRLKTLIQGDSD